MRRREFIGLLVAAAAVTWPGFARAQSLAGGVKRPVIGILSIRTSEHDSAIKTFLDALATLGYVDGKSAIIVARYAAGEQGALPKLADELARLNPDVIMADAPSPIKAAMSAAPNIPIVGATTGSPVRQGLIASFSRPGGNVTGIASQVEDVTAKLLGFGMEMVPDAKHMGLLIDPRADNAAVMRRDFQAAAEERGIGFHTAEAHVPNELDGAIRQLADAGVAFICIAPTGMFNLNLSHIGQTARELRVATITNRPETADTGILLGYGADPDENFQRAATFVGKILKGAKPGDLPVEFTTKLKMVINLKTANVLGLTVPLTLQAAADEAIE
jgi:putative ABC transport system substrate-binding protein